MAETYPPHNHATQKRKAIQVSIVVFLLIGTMLIAGVLFRTDLPFGQCHRLSCLQLSKNAVLKLTEVYEDVHGATYRARYQMNDGGILRVDVRSGIEPDTATDYIRGRVAGMKALYDNVRSPYPGLLSNEIVCDSAFKPLFESVRTSSGVSIEKITGYLNDRLTFGSCLEDQATYKGAMLLFACPNHKQLYQLEIIFPRVKYTTARVTEVVTGLQCK